MTTTSLYKKLYRIAAEKKLWLRVLGEVGPYPMWYVSNHGSHTNHPRLLITAGFHGEEIAGPIALIQWLELFDPNLYKKVNLSFIPIVNPIGFNKRKRYNDKNEKTNCGFCHPESGDRPSQEGIILLKNAQLLRAASRHGFLSLHEDVTTDKFYLYTFEREQEPTNFTYVIRDVLGSFFTTPLHGETVTTDTNGGKSTVVENGIVYKLCDGSFEDFLFHEGTLRAVVTETPGMCSLNTRIRANATIITEFIELSLCTVNQSMNDVRGATKLR